MIPGEIIPGAGDIEINPGRAVLSLTVRNTGDRPVQVGSHFHFAESNVALEFDRAAAWGYRLAVPAGTSVRFEPGMPRDVDLVELRGNRIVPGLRGLTGGRLDGEQVDGERLDGEQLDGEQLESEPLEGGTKTAPKTPQPQAYENGSPR